MRRLLRLLPPALAVICPEGQVFRTGLCVLLALGVAFPARATPPSEPVAPVAETPAPAPPVGDANVSPAAPEAPVTSTTAEVSLSERQAEARRVFRLAKQQFNAGEYAEAARSFEASFAAAESAEAAYNAALAHDKAGSRLMTMAWFRRYLGYESSTSDTGYPHALRRVEELRARLGELRLQVDSRDPVRAVLINGEPVQLSEFPRLVEPGRIEVRLLGDRADQVADIPAEVAAGGTWTIHFTGFARTPVEPLPRVATSPVVRTDPLPDPELERRRRLLGGLAWTGVGVTAASAITMGVLGGLALRKQAAWEQRLCGDDDHVCSDQYAEAQADNATMRRYQDATNVMVGVTAGLAVITLALGIAALRARQKVRDSGKARLRVTFAGLQLAF